MLGKGASGIVYKAYQKLEDKHAQNYSKRTLHRVVALKEVRIKANITQKEYRDLTNEVEIMKQIQHPNIIQLYQYFVDD